MIALGCSQPLLVAVAVAVAVTLPAAGTHYTVGTSSISTSGATRGRLLSTTSCSRPELAAAAAAAAAAARAMQLQACAPPLQVAAVASACSLEGRCAVSPGWVQRTRECGPHCSSSL